MNRDKSEGCRNRAEENTWDLNVLSHLKTQPHHWGESAPCPDLLHSFFWTYCRQHHVYLLLQAWVVLGWVNSSWAPRDTFFLKMVSFFFFSPLLSPPPLSAFSVPLIIILATNKSGFPLSNQIIPAVLDLAGIWCRQILACSLWRCADQARPDAQMLLFCNHICAEVWRFGKADFSSVWSLSQGLFDIFIKDPDDGREMILIMTADHRNLSVNRIPPRKIIST